MIYIKYLFIFDGYSSYLIIKFDHFCKQNIIICLYMPCLFIFYIFFNYLMWVVLAHLKECIESFLKYMIASNNYIKKTFYRYI